MKLKTKVTTVEEVEVDVSLPVYTRSGIYYYMLCEDRILIKVFAGEAFGYITSMNPTLENSYERDVNESLQSEQITRDEFMQVYNSTLASFRKSLEPNELP